MHESYFPDTIPTTQMLHYSINLFNDVERKERDRDVRTKKLQLRNASSSSERDADSS